MVIDMENEERLIKGNYENIGGKRACLRFNVRGEKFEFEKAARDYEEAVRIVLNVIQDEKYNVISSLDEIGAVGHRIVHGGEKYSESVLIDDEVLEKSLNLLYNIENNFTSLISYKKQSRIISNSGLAYINGLKGIFLIFFFK